MNCRSFDRQFSYFFSVFLLRTSHMITITTRIAAKYHGSHFALI